MNSCAKLEKLFEKLNCSKLLSFPNKGRVNVTDSKGVYIVYNTEKEVLHVGSTPRGKNGLNQRLYNHLTGSSSFSRKFLKPNNISLRDGYTFRFIEVDDARTRGLLESLTIGKLCPKHFGTGE